MIIAAFTGHRPDKLGGYELNNPRRMRIRHTIRNLDIDGAITGGALGVDQDAAMAVHDRDIPYIVAAPCRGQSAKWPELSQALYQEICQNSDPELMTHIIHISDVMTVGIEDLGMYKNVPVYIRHGVIYTFNNPYPGPWVMQRRNEWMVDHCDILYAFWDGTSGGTANCVKYAAQIGKPYVNLWKEIV
jgi:uncharacterized phage-like protein YoqJ